MSFRDLWFNHFTISPISAKQQVFFDESWSKNCTLHSPNPKLVGWSLKPWNDKLQHEAMMIHLSVLSNKHASFSAPFPFEKIIIPVQSDTVTRHKLCFGSDLRRYRWIPCQPHWFSLVEFSRDIKWWLIFVNWPWPSCDRNCVLLHMEIKSEQNSSRPPPLPPAVALKKYADSRGWKGSKIYHDLRSCPHGRYRRYWWGTPETRTISTVLILTGSQGINIRVSW